MPSSRKEQKSQIRNPTYHLKELEKGQAKTEVCQRKETIKSREEIKIKNNNNKRN